MLYEFHPGRLVALLEQVEERKRRNGIRCRFRDTDRRISWTTAPVTPPPAMTVPVAESAL
jgi:hypothetical protein